MSAKIESEMLPHQWHQPRRALGAVLLPRSSSATTDVGSKPGYGQSRTRTVPLPATTRPSTIVKVAPSTTVSESTRSTKHSTVSPELQRRGRRIEGNAGASLLRSQLNGGPVAREDGPAVISGELELRHESSRTRPSVEL